MVEFARDLVTSRYSVAVTSVAILVGSKYVLALFQVPVHDSSLLMFLLSVVASAAYGGLVPGLIATALSLGIALWWRSSVPESVADIAMSWLRVTAFAIEGVVISWGAQLVMNLRRRHSAEIEALVRRLKAVIDTTPIAVITYRSDGIVLTWNKAAEQIYGWAAEEVLGKPVPFLLSSSEQQWAEMIAANLASKPLAGAEVIRVHKTGRQVPIQLWTAVVRDNADAYHLHMASDLSEKKRIEEQLRQTSKMEAIGRLAGGIAHDLNNVLQVIVSYAHMMEEPGIDHTEAVREIIRASDRASDMTSHLLAFSRQKIAHPKLLAVDTHIQAQTNFIRRLLTDQVRLELNLMATGTQILIDPVHFDQILVNLAANARQAMPQGGRLLIETATHEIDRQSHPVLEPGRYVTLHVTDNGVGMTDDVRSRIFEPFFSTKKEQGGTGLGLATVYGIVKQNGGDIFVYSEPGTGTSFHIYLPARAGAPEAALKPIAAPPRSSGQEKILVVEDDQQILHLIERMLVGHNYHVWATSDGNAAIEYARTHPGQIDLLLTDILMPEKNGREIADDVSVFQPHMKIVFMSGFPGHMQQGFLPPNLSFLQKPFTAAALLTRVREVLDGGQHRP